MRVRGFGGGNLRQDRNPRPFGFAQGRLYFSKERRDRNQGRGSLEGSRKSGLRSGEGVGCPCRRRRNTKRPNRSGVFRRPVFGQSRGPLLILSWAAQPKERIPSRLGSRPARRRSRASCSEDP